MTLTRLLCGLTAVVGTTAPAVGQYAPPRPAPQGPTRLVFVAPPWITNAPRTGIPAPAALQPTSPEAQPAPRPMPVTIPVPAVVPAVPAVPAVPPAAPVAPPAVTPASATAPRTATRPDVWRSGTPTLPGTVVPAPKGR